MKKSISDFGIAAFSGIGFAKSSPDCKESRD
jgi:hypothetical protein